MPDVRGRHHETVNSGAGIKKLLTLVMTIKSETPCEPELLLFPGMNDHLHAAGLLEQLRKEETTPKKIWTPVQTLLSAMVEIQELLQ